MAYPSMRALSWADLPWAFKTLMALMGYFTLPDGSIVFTACMHQDQAAQACVYSMQECTYARAQGKRAGKSAGVWASSVKHAQKAHHTPPCALTFLGWSVIQQRWHQFPTSDCKVLPTGGSTWLKLTGCSGQHIVIARRHMPTCASSITFADPLNAHTHMLLKSLHYYGFAPHSSALPT
eukprot:1148937-Pelagomonas_calceolata.AAC.1